MTTITPEIVREWLKEIPEPHHASLVFASQKVPPLDAVELAKAYLEVCGQKETAETVLDEIIKGVGKAVKNASIKNKLKGMEG